MTHWCLDIPRDEAVRAPEDNRSGPLPTREEAIAKPFADSPGASETERLRADADHLLSLVNGQTKDFGELLEVVGRIDARVERLEGMIPKNASPTSAPEHKNKGERMETNGLRTERVTLEITHSESSSAASWAWGNWPIPGQSVRVVDGDITDGEIRLRDQRDAAIRERDAAKSDAEKSAVLIKSQAENVAYFRRDRDETRLRAEAAEARVAELESERDAAIRERDEFRRSFHWSEEAGTRLVAERDASRDDADGLRILVAELEAERDGLQVDVSALMDVGHRLGSQVASLELQLESVACRAATAETALESAPPPASGWLTEEERDFLDHHRRECEGRASTFSEARAVPWCRRLKMIDALLARSTPPEVVRPGTQVRYHRLSVEEQRDDQWLAALAAAGVTVEAKQ